MLKKILFTFFLLALFGLTASNVNAESLLPVLKGGTLEEGFLNGAIERGIYASSGRVYFRGTANYEQTCQNKIYTIVQSSAVSTENKAVYTKKLNKKTHAATYFWKINFDLSAPSDNICPKGYKALSKITLGSKTGKIYLSDTLGAVPLLDDSDLPIEINIP